MKKQKKQLGKIKKIIVDPHAYDDAILTWRAPEYLHHEKSKLWYLIASLILVGLVWYGLSSNGWTFSLAIIVCAGTYYLFQHHAPAIVDIKVSGVGVKVGRHKFPFSGIKGFWLVNEPPHANKIYLRMQSRVHPDIAISLDGANPVEVQRILSKYSREIKGNFEPFSDTLVRLFRL